MPVRVIFPNAGLTRALVPRSMQGGWGIKMTCLRPVVAIAFLLSSLCLAACATNMSNVATFGDATAAVAQQTVVVLPKMPLPASSAGGLSQQADSVRSDYHRYLKATY